NTAAEFVLIQGNSPTYAPTLRRRFQNLLRLQSVREIGAGFSSPNDRSDKIGHGVNEGVLVANEVTRRPPLVDVRMGRLRHQNVAEPLSILPRRSGASRKKSQPIHLFEIENERTVAAIDFQSERILSSGRKTRRFQTRQRAVSKSADHRHRIIDIDAATTALLHKCFAHCANIFEFAHQIPRKIDNVRADVAERARPGPVALQAPDQRKFWIDNPILRITRAKMKNAFPDF